MKKFFLLSLGVLVSSMSSAQTVHVDVANQECKLAGDSLVVQMTLSGSIEDLNSRDAIVLTPYINSQTQGFDLPRVQYNGRYKQILYIRNKDMKSKMSKSEAMSEGYVQGLGSNGKFSVDYSVSLAFADWMNDATIQIRCDKMDIENEVENISDIFVQEIELNQRSTNMTPLTPATYASREEANSTVAAAEPVKEQNYVKPQGSQNYRGTYVAPDSDATDERNQRDFNFSLEEAQVMVNVNPQILSLKELFTVALSYKEDREKFYNIILTSVKLYPTHPIANLNAASMAIEMGDKAAANKYLQIAPYESLAYKNCRGAYELMTDNVSEGIRLLKSAKSEGSEDAGYNLELFFNRNK